ncbi:DUF4846 domain-containing protein [Candidatus Dependentiae bacterium]|nr:DUF4846 domain-containing protein [Candidatus Dependentiae bacterium]
MKKCFCIFIIIFMINNLFAESDVIKPIIKIKDIPLPKGYKRLNYDLNSYEYWLSSRPLKKTGSKVYLFNGKLKNNQNVHYAVIDIDVGNKNLQQCADAVIRLRSEYLYSQNLYEKISFGFVNGFKAEYSKWRRGYSIKVNNNKCCWIPVNQNQSDYTGFRKYLDIVFSYANSFSLQKEMSGITKISDINIGDVFIQGGFPGHAVIVVDLAVNTSNDFDKIFLLAQSYMPAQDIHILKNITDENLTPWYNVNFQNELITPEWTFYKNDLYRFKKK